MIFDVSNPPAQPDSELDPDMSLAHSFPLADGTTLSISPGDWADVDPQYINPDPSWPDAGAVGIMILTDPINDGYTESQLTVNPEVLNNFSRVSKVS